MRLKKFDEALMQLKSIETSIYADRGIIMAGQIYEQVYNDIPKAMEYYMLILNEHSDSVYSEPIRYHIRKLKNIKKI